jgi:hypothetical protein
MWMVQERPDVRRLSGVQVIDANDMVSALHEAIAQMRADETCTASHNNGHTRAAAQNGGRRVVLGAAKLF